MLPISLEEALARGLKRYFTGVTCRNGHLDERYVNGRACASCMKETQRSQRKIHAEFLLRKNREYRRNNPDWNRKRHRKYRANHPESVRAARRNRKALERGSSGGTHTAADVANIFRMQRGKCAYCRTRLGEKYHVDHIIPLARGGGNAPSNLQILCIPCNRSKSASEPIKYAQSLGRLL